MAAQANPYADLDAAQAAQDAQTAASRSAVPANNPYADLDAQQAAQDAANAPPSALSQAFQKPAPASVGSLIESPFVGFNAGVADVLGAPADAWNWARGKLGGTSVDNPLGGSQMIKQGLGLIGANPDDRPATTTAERIGQGIGSGAAAAIVPEAAVGTLGRMGLAAAAPKVADLAGQVFGNADRTSQVLGNAAVGGASGGTGQAAAEVVPDQYKPAAHFVGGLAGGLGAAGVGAIGNAVAKPAIAGAADYLRPLNVLKGSAADQAAAGAVAPGFTPNQVDMAREAVVSAIKPDADTGVSMNPNSKFNTVNQLADQQPSSIPGYASTPFQSTGNQGLGGLEERMSQSNPDTRADFVDFRANQNNALTAHIAAQQPTGEAAAVPQLFNDQLARFDSLASQGVNDASMASRVAASNVGGTGTAEDAGNTLRGNLSGARNDIAGQNNALWDLVPKTLAVDMSPVKAAATDTYSGLSKAAASELTPAETRIQGLVGGYNGVEPFSELKDLRSSLTTAIANDKAGTNPNPSAQRRLSMVLDGVNQSIGNGLGEQAARDANAVKAGAMAPADTLQSKLQGFRSDWNDVARAEPGGVASRTGTADAGTPALGPSQSAGADGAAAYPGGRPQSPASGSAIPQAPVEPNALNDFIQRKGGLQSKPLFGPDQANVHPDLVAQQGGLSLNQMHKQAVDAGVMPGTSSPVDLINGITDSARPTPIGSATSTPLGQKLVANFGSADLAKLKNASAMHSYLRGAYDDSGTAVGKVLSTNGRGRYDLLDAQVPDALFKAGPAGEQIAKQYIQEARGQLPVGRQTADMRTSPLYSDAANSTADQRQQAAVRDLENAAAVKYRKEAMPNGVADPVKHAAFVSKYADALRAIPDAANRFGTAAQAEQRVGELTTARKTMLDELQKGAFGKMMGDKDPVQGLQSILGQPDRVAQVRALANRVNASGSDDAKQGLRKAFVDLIERKLVSNTEAGTTGKDVLKSDQFQTFIKQNRAAMAQVFNPKEIDNFQAVAAALKERNRSITGNKLPTGSDTAQKLFPLLKAELEKNHEGPVSQAAKVAVPATLAGGLTGGAGAVASVVGNAVLGKARDAGLAKVQDLVKEAMLNPDLMKSLMQRVPKAPGTGSEITLAHQLSRVGLISSANAAAPQSDGQDRPAYARGGAVKAPGHPFDPNGPNWALAKIARENPSLQPSGVEDNSSIKDALMLAKRVGSRPHFDDGGMVPAHAGMLNPYNGTAAVRQALAYGRPGLR